MGLVGGVHGDDMIDAGSEEDCRFLQGMPSKYFPIENLGKLTHYIRWPRNCQDRSGIVH